MFIASSLNMSALQRSAMCLGGFSYIPLLTERSIFISYSYKHLAPPEQILEQLNPAIRTKLLRKPY